MKRAGAASVTVSGTKYETRPGRVTSKIHAYLGLHVLAPRSQLRGAAHRLRTRSIARSACEDYRDVYEKGAPTRSAPRRRRPQNKEAASPPTMFLRGSPTKRRHRGLRETGRSFLPTLFLKAEAASPAEMTRCTQREVRDGGVWSGCAADRRRGAIALRGKHFC